MKRFSVDVDSGVIEIARNPDHLKAGSDLYGKIQDLALWTASAVWDGKKGAIGTPDGDGPHEVIYDPAVEYKWKEWQGLKGGFLQNLPKGELAKPFTLYFGDVGRADGAIKFPEHNGIAFAWVDSNTLQFISYV